jgi:hypothetical protein
MHKPIPIRPPIHPVFTKWLRDMIDEKAGQAVQILSPSMPTDKLYSYLVPKQFDRTELQAAAELMRPMKNFSDHSFELNVHALNLSSTVEFSLIMPVPPRWNAILMPDTRYCATIGGPEGGSELTDLIMPALTVAQSWAVLKHVTMWMIEHSRDRTALRDMFPWLPELIQESDWQSYYNYRALSRDQKEACDRTFAAALKLTHGGAPRMTPAIRAICLSGTKLFSQIRMMKLVDETKFEQLQMRTTDSASLVPSISGNLIPQSVNDDLADIRELRK